MFFHENPSQSRILSIASNQVGRKGNAALVFSDALRPKRPIRVEEVLKIGGPARRASKTIINFR